MRRHTAEIHQSITHLYRGEGCASLASSEDSPITTDDPESKMKI